MDKEGVSVKKIYSVDHGWAWLVALGMASWNFAIGGTIKSSGVLFTEFLELFGDTLSSTTWITASIMLTNFLFSPLTGYMQDKCSHTGKRIITGAAAVISGVSMLGAAWSNNIYQAIVFFGLVPGIGSAVLDVFVISSVRLYFKKRRFLATSIAANGSSAGGIALPFLITLSLDAHGIRGAMMLIAGIWLHIIVFAALMRPLSRHERHYIMENEMFSSLTNKNESITDKSNATDLVSDKLSISLEFSHEHNDISESLCHVSPVARSDFKKTWDDSENSDDLRSEHLSTNKSLVINEIPSSMPPDQDLVKTCFGSQSSASDKHCVPKTEGKSCWEAVKDYWDFLCTPGLMQLCATFILAVTAYFTQFFILPPLMTDSGISKVYAAQVVSVCCISELCCRPFVGFITDKYPHWKILLLSTTFIVSAIAGVVLSLVTIQWMFMGYAVLTGSFGGAHIPFIVPMLLEKAPTRWAGSAVGMYVFVTGVGMTCGPPIISLLKTYTGSYKVGLLFLSACYVAAFLVLVMDHIKKMFLYVLKRK